MRRGGTPAFIYRWDPHLCSTMRERLRAPASSLFLHYGLRHCRLRDWRDSLSRGLFRKLRLRRCFYVGNRVADLFKPWLLQCRGDVGQSPATDHRAMNDGPEGDRQLVDAGSSGDVSVRCVNAWKTVAPRSPVSCANESARASTAGFCRQSLLNLTVSPEAITKAGSTWPVKTIPAHGWPSIRQPGSR